MKKLQIFYYISLALAGTLMLLGGAFLGFEGKEFYYMFTSLLFLVAPFISLLFILFIEIKKIEFARSQYVEPYLVILMIAGSLLLWLYTKLDLDLKLVYWYILSIVLFAVITIVFIIVAKKHKNEPKKGPKFIANR